MIDSIEMHSQPIPKPMHRACIQSPFKISINPQEKVMRRLVHDHCTSIRMPWNWHTNMTEIAKQFGISHSEIYRQAVQHFLRIRKPDLSTSIK